TIGLAGARLIAGKVERVLALGPDGRARDFVFADPPYALSDQELEQMLVALVSQRWLAPGAIVAVERATRSGPPTWPSGYEPDRSRKYGEATLWYGPAAGALPVATSPTGA